MQLLPDNHEWQTFNGPYKAEDAARPLTPDELVTDEFLRQLAKDSPERQCGELSTEDQTMLAMILPDICGELLAHRAAMRVK